MDSAKAPAVPLCLNVCITCHSDLLLRQIAFVARRGRDKRLSKGHQGAFISVVRVSREIRRRAQLEIPLRSCIVPRGRRLQR